MFSNLHIYKTNSILQAAATGVDKGWDPTNHNLLSTLDATAALVIYFHFLLDSCVVRPY
jgi:hypothetical protein